MSINLNSGIAVGFKLTKDEISRFPREIYDDLRDYEFLIELDCYEPGEHILAFYIQYGPEPGCMKEFTNPIKYEPSDYKEIVDTFNRYFPERKDEEPKIYLYTRIW